MRHEAAPPKRSAQHNCPQCIMPERPFKIGAASQHAGCAALIFRIRSWTSILSACQSAAQAASRKKLGWLASEAYDRPRDRPAAALRLPLPLLLYLSHAAISRQARLVAAALPPAAASCRQMQQILPLRCMPPPLS